MNISFSFLKSPFFRNVLSLTSGSVVAQTVSIVTVPMLARVYNPSVYGVYALFAGCINIVALIATARYELAIILPKDDKESVNVIALSLSISALVCLSMLLVLFLFRQSLEIYSWIATVGKLMYLIPINVFLVSFWQCLNYWNNRKNRYRRLSMNRVYKSLVTAIVSLLLGFVLCGNVVGLIWSFFIANIFGVIHLAIQPWKEDRSLHNCITIAKIKESAVKHSDMPKYNTIQALSDGFRTEGIVFVLKLFYDEGVVGAYFMAMRILQLPANFIGGAISQVFYREASRVNNEEKNLFLSTKKVVFSTIMIALPLFLGFYYLSPLFILFLGEKWYLSVDLMKVMIPFVAIGFVASPLSTIPLILKKQREFAVLGIFYGFYSLLLLYITAIVSTEIRQHLFFYSLFISIFLIYVCHWLVSQTKPERQLIV